MPDKTTLNRCPLFGLFAYRAARHMGYPEEDARLLGYSTALLYAIYKAKAKTETITFGGQEFMVIPGRGKQLKQTVVGHEVHDPEDYDAEVEAKFPEGWHDRLAKAFDKYLQAYDAEQLNKGNVLFDLYKAWRDQCKVGFNRVDLDSLVEWLHEHAAER